MKHLLFFVLLAANLKSLAFSITAGATVGGCSGAVFKMDGRKDSQKAFVITNGHCLRLKDLRGDASHYPGPFEIIFDIRGPNLKDSTVITVQGAKGSFNVTPERLIFATMSGTDVSIFELTETYHTLADRYGVDALRLDSRPFAVGDKIDIHAAVFNRTQSCAIAGRVSLAEGPYRTKNALRFSKECAIYNGFSGAPLVRPDGKTFAGLANTHYEAEAEGQACAFGKPCEVGVNNERRVPAPGQSYGVGTESLYTCFEGSTGEFNFKKNGCAFRLRSETEYYPRLAGSQVMAQDPENATLVVIENSKYGKCSGVFVAKDVVLTAAHCLEGTEKEPGIGVPGDAVYPLSLPEGYDPLRGEKRRVVKAVTHPSKKEMDIWVQLTANESFPFDNPDMALLKLNAPYENAVVAELASQELKSGDAATFAGFGRGKQDWQRPDRIDYQVLSTDFKAIAADYSDLTPEDGMYGFMQALNRDYATVTPYFYFMRSPEPGVQTACYGDSGGPLYTVRDGRLQVYGVASIYFPHPNKGNPGCGDSFLASFAKVSPHLVWLKSEIAQLSSERP